MRVDRETVWGDFVSFHSRRLGEHCHMNDKISGMPEGFQAKVTLVRMPAIRIKTPSAYAFIDTPRTYRWSDRRKSRGTLHHLSNLSLCPTVHGGGYYLYLP